MISNKLGFCLTEVSGATDCTAEVKDREWLRMEEVSASDRRRRRTFAAMSGGVEPERGTKTRV